MRRSRLIDDLVTELQASDHSRAESEARAEERLGSEDALIADIMARPELRSWARRWPWAAFVVFRLFGFALLFGASMLAMAGAVGLWDHVFGIAPVHSRGLRIVCETFVVPFLWFMLPKARRERAPRSSQAPRPAID